MQFALGSASLLFSIYCLTLPPLPLALSCSLPLSCYARTLLSMGQWQWLHAAEDKCPWRRQGLLLKFALGPGGITFVDGAPAGADLHFVGPANQRRGRADAFSKVRHSVSWHVAFIRHSLSQVELHLNIAILRLGWLSVVVWAHGHSSNASQSLLDVLHYCFGKLCRWRLQASVLLPCSSVCKLQWVMSIGCNAEVSISDLVYVWS